MAKKLALPVVVMFLLAFAAGCEKADEKSFGEFEATANSLTGQVTEVELTPGEMISTSGTYGDAAAGTDPTTEPEDTDDEKDEDGDDDGAAASATTTSVASTDETTGPTVVVQTGSAGTETVPDLLGGKDTVVAGAATKESTSEVDLLGEKGEPADDDADAEDDDADEESAADAALEAKELEVKRRANQVIDAMAEAGFKREDGRPDLRKILDKMADYLDEHDGNVTVAQFVEDMTGSKAFRDLPTKLELIVDKVRGDKRTYFERDADETEE